jgi:hypothetical protein
MLKQSNSDHNMVFTKSKEEGQHWPQNSHYAGRLLNFFNSGHKEFLVPVPTHDIDRLQDCSRRKTHTVVYSTEAQVWPRHRSYIGGSTVLKEKRTRVCLLLSQEESE